MCIGVYTLEHPDYALILATNRDEFLHRPTEDAHWHSFERSDAPLPQAPAHVSSSAIEQAASTTGAVLPAQGPALTSGSSGHASSAAAASAGLPGPILSGRDLQAGGTWLGLSRAGGRIALLTNITEPLAKWAVSRGELVAGFLTMPEKRDEEMPNMGGGGVKGRGMGNAVLRQWEERMCVNGGGGAGEYAGFNLLLLAPRIEQQIRGDGGYGDGGKVRVAYDARFVTNHGGGGPLASRPLSVEERRCGGISNGVDHSYHSRSRLAGEEVEDEDEVTNDVADEWPKVRRARGDFAALLQQQGKEEIKVHSDSTEEELVERLFRILEWHPTTPIAHRSELRNTVHVLPIRIGLPAFVNSTGDSAHKSTDAPTSATVPDIKAMQTETTLSTPGSTTVQGFAAGLMPQGEGPLSIAKPKADPKTETPPAFYGTRLATVVLVPRDPAREALFVERDIWALGGDDPNPDPARASGRELRVSGAEKRPLRVDKSRQRVFRFRMDFGDDEP